MSWNIFNSIKSDIVSFLNKENGRIGIAFLFVICHTIDGKSKYVLKKAYDLKLMLNFQEKTGKYMSI